MQLLLEKNLIFAGIKFCEFREFTHFHNFRENQISRFFKNLRNSQKLIPLRSSPKQLLKLSQTNLPSPLRLPRDNCFLKVTVKGTGIVAKKALLL